MSYSLYRRHGRKCGKSNIFDMKCNCPIWLYGRVDGEVVRRSLKTRKLPVASQRLAQFEENPEAVIGYTLEQGLADYLASCRNQNLATNTTDSYRNSIQPFIAVCTEQGITEPKRVTLKTMEHWLAVRNCAPNTKRLELVIIRQFFKYMLKHKHISHNVASDLKPPKKDETPTLPYSPDEVSHLFSRCKSNKYWALMLVMLYSGLRISDTIQLKKGTIDAEGRLLLRMEKTGHPVYVKLPQTVLDALEAIPEDVRTPYYFWSGTSTLRSACRNANRFLERLGEAAQVAGARPHRFRDTFAVNLLLSGASVYTLQKLLGHKSVLTTERAYAPWVREMQGQLDAATEKLVFAV